jgi:TIR domain/von Willebrand factor type A domain
VWIILLDHSSSMADPFSNSAAELVRGRVRQSAATTKWDAAKEAVVDEVNGLDEEEAICLIEFTSTASVVFEGKRSKAERLQSLVDELVPRGSTDIATALKVASEYANAASEPQISIEVISDGLSDLNSAGDAARELAKRAGLIDVILIDPSAEGQAVARAVAIRGRVIPVLSAPDLGREAQEAAQRHSAEASRIAEVLARAKADREAVGAMVPARERLAFTVGYPNTPSTDIWYFLLVLLHLRRLENEVRQRLGRKSKQSGQRFDSTTTETWVNRGIWLALTPRVDGVEFNPITHEVAWYEDIQEVEFRFRAPGSLAGETRIGSVDIQSSGLPIAQIPIAIRLRRLEAVGQSQNDPDGWVDHQGSLPNAIFASYSHADRDVVQACAKAYRALGIDLYVDRESLTAGHEWHPALLRLIEESDAFQLYWSDASSNSVYVQQEYRHALSLRNLKGDIFVRPLYWHEPMPPPPNDLSAIHFGFLDLAAMRSSLWKSSEDTMQEVRSGNASGATTAQDSRERLPELELVPARNIQAPVIPLTAGTTRQMLKGLRQALGNAIAFLEGITALRYYPVTTLLIDKYTVQQVRRMQRTMDDIPEATDEPPSEAKTDLELWRDVMRSLLLDFHVRKVPPLIENELDKGPAEQNIPDYSEVLVGGLREFAEWGVSRWVTDYLFFPWEDASKPLPSTSDRELLSQKTLKAIDQFLEAATRAKLQSKTANKELSFARPTSSDPSQFDDRLAWESVSTEPCLKNFAVARRTGQYIGSSPWSARVNTRPDYEVVGSTSQMLEVLVRIRDLLAILLPEFDGRDYSRSEPAEQSGLRCIGLTIVAQKITEKLNWDLPDHDRIYGKWIGTWVTEVIQPSWRRTLAWLGANGMADMVSDLTFPQFLSGFFATMLNLFQYGVRKFPTFDWKSAYSISGAAWAAIQKLDSESQLRSEHSSRADDNEVLLRGPFIDYLKLFERGSEQLLRRLAQIPPRRSGVVQARTLAQTLFEIATHGIYVPEYATAVNGRLAEWAARNHLLPLATLPDTPRVLVCTESWNMADQGPAKTPNPLLLQCVLVHEHFHAILETGMASVGISLDKGSREREWAEATSLNESLAAWMEVHYLRRHASFTTDREVAQAQAAVWDYIRAGPYPQWPYRGAEKVEALFRQGGIGAIRKLISELRQNPSSAQREFDQMKNSPAEWAELS